MGKNNFLQNFSDHIRLNFWLYVISLIFIFTGVVLGIYSVKYMPSVNKNDLLSYLNSFGEYLTTKDLDYRFILIQSIKSNIPFIVVIWFLGMTMIGIPIILIIDLIKGYTLGFTISFVISSVGIKGFNMAMLGVIPQNIIYVPCIIFSSVLAMEFSLNFLRERINNKLSSGLLVKVMSYSVSFLVIFFAMFFGFVIEAYITPNILKIIV
ncbi:stage II sporulation protein M [Clostridium rectalis]|uniref:stage II sporulation protein M n=1 Tax=Clostridium rectalis TaxID=2040295 RepID=UPI000F635209|nr:stage II sporulation protein M [Clostridium rectalis]